MWFYSWVLQKNSWTHQTKLIISHLYLLMISPDITHIWNSYHISYMINASLQLAIEILQPCTEPSIWQLIRQTEEVTAKSKMDFLWIWIICRADSKFAPSQWETSLQSNDVSHWLGTNLESALICEKLLQLWNRSIVCVFDKWIQFQVVPCSLYKTPILVLFMLFQGSIMQCRQPGLLKTTSSYIIIKTWNV